MKFPILFLALVGILLPMTHLSASDKTSRPHRRHFTMGKVDRLLRKFDADRDGSLDKMEIAVMLEERQKHRKKDEVVPKSAQVAPFPSRVILDRAEKLLIKFDKNGDGVLGRNELAAMLGKHSKRHPRHSHKKTVTSPEKETPPTSQASPAPSPATTSPVKTPPPSPPLTTSPDSDSMSPGS